MYERTIVVNGFSKSYAMTGWRLGYALGPIPVIAQMTKLHQYGIMSAPTTAQYAAIEALRNGDRDVEMMRGEYDMRRRLVVDSFNAMGLTCFEPLGVSKVQVLQVRNSVQDLLWTSMLPLFRVLRSVNRAKALSVCHIHILSSILKLRLKESKSFLMN